MIPILYEKGETAFQSNGLGRLTDCISCKVPEERNGIYTVDFSYPVSGWLFDRIQLGRIILVTHDETGDLQPFDIVSYSKPIDGIVTFHAVHISYRLTKAVSYATNVSSLAQALGLLSTTEFTFSSDMTSSAYMAAFDGVPKSIRQLVGGTEGSLLDTYGGELEWDRFSVILHASRGQKRNFAIRYGVNMTGYQDDTDYSDSFNACVPYWIKDDTIVIGNETSSGAQTAGGRTDVVPLDLSTMFEDEPTTAQLEAAALDYMREKGAHLPQQNIKVDFVRLQDLGFEELGGLMKCNLCDTIDVIFPAYGMRGTYKIVRTVWDVLADRYEEMELGSLRTTLSEALGVTNTAQGVASGGGGGGTPYFYGTCATAQGTAAKIVVCPEFTGADLTAGTLLFVDFTAANTASNPTINVNGTGAKIIYRYGTTMPSTSAASSWNAGSVVAFIYDGTAWTMVGWINTTYSSMTVAEINAGTGTAARLITPARLKTAIETWEEQPLTGSTTQVTPTQVWNAVGSGRPIAIQYTDAQFNEFVFDAFNYAEAVPGVASTTIMTVAGVIYSATLIGDVSTDLWTLQINPLGTSTTPADYVTEEGTSGSWTYRKWSSGLQEAWYSGSITFSAASSVVNGWNRSTQNVTLPLTFADDAVVQVTGAASGKIYTSGGIKTSGTQFEAQILSGASTSAATYAGWHVYVIGQARS